MPDSNPDPDHPPVTSPQDLAEAVTQGFAADLHDDLVPLLYVGRQSLLNACDQVRTLAQQLSERSEIANEDDGKTAEKLEAHLADLKRIEDWLSKAMEVSRGLIRQAHLPEEELPRWWDALQHTVASLFPRETRVQWMGQPPASVSPEVARALYRIAGEAVRNAIRHSDAKRITVAWEASPSNQASDNHEEPSERETPNRMTISDDGVGFDPAGVGAGRFGLLGMRMRANLVGLPLTIQSQPGGPTLITVDFDSATGDV